MRLGTTGKRSVELMLLSVHACTVPCKQEGVANGHSVLPCSADLVSQGTC